MYACCEFLGKEPEMRSLTGWEDSLLNARLVMLVEVRMSVEWKSTTGTSNFSFFSGVDSGLKT